MMDRRQFLVTTSVAGIGVFLAVPVKAGRPVSPTPKRSAVGGPYALYGSPRTGCARRPGLSDSPATDL